MSTSGSKSNEHVAHFLVDIHNQGLLRNEGVLDMFKSIIYIVVVN